MKWRIIAGLLIVGLGLGALYVYQYQGPTPVTQSAPAGVNPDYRDLTIPTK